MNVVQIYRSPEHNYFGHYGRDPGTTPMGEVARARLLAGRGVEGDRFSLEVGTKGQVSFFALEVWMRLCRELNRTDRQPDVFRRNIVVQGTDLNALVGRDFVVQGVRFHGVEYCKPCFWMDRAFAPGAFALLSEWKAGGLRASVLSDGWLCVSAAESEPCSA